MLRAVLASKPVNEGIRGFGPQVWNLEIVAEHVVTIELDQRVEIKDRLQTCKYDNHEDDIVNECMVVGDAPDNGAQTPEDELEIASRKCHPHPLPLRREHP